MGCILAPCFSFDFGANDFFGEGMDEVSGTGFPGLLPPGPVWDGYGNSAVGRFSDDSD